MCIRDSHSALTLRTKSCCSSRRCSTFRSPPPMNSDGMKDLQLDHKAEGLQAALALAEQSQGFKPVSSWTRRVGRAVPRSPCIGITCPARPLQRPKR
eukprot:6457011-Amphidinium_carterae.1